jgi:hypothetical protein
VEKLEEEQNHATVAAMIAAIKDLNGRLERVETELVQIRADREVSAAMVEMFADH